MAARRREDLGAPEGAGATRPSFPLPVLLLTLITALGAAAALHGLPAAFAWGGAVVVGLAGGAVTALLAAGGPSREESRADALLESLETGADRAAEVRRGGRAWTALQEKAASLAQEARTGRTAVAELERFRRQVELATASYREGKDPLAEAAELRVGPLRDLLESAKEGANVGPVVSRLPLGEAELVGVDGEPFPVPWPAGADETTSMDPRARVEARRELEDLIQGLRGLSDVLAGTPAGPAGGAAGVRTPAQLVDAVVHTAADGIEDLAAGLMRANELASVAERVTNRATLLALNAALEATRSGSEAFAAIAEETRRLAEFAREATDTISRLANEIEYKVGETIHAIHAASEDAKSSVAALGGAAPAPGAAAAAAEARSRVRDLLRRAEEMRRALGAGAPALSGTLPAPVAPAALAAPSAPAAPSSPRVPAVPSSPSAADEPSTAGSFAPGAPPSFDPGVPDAAPDAASALPAAPSAGDAPPDALGVSGGFLTIDPRVGEDLVENAGSRAENKGTKDFLLLEGLEPGSRYAG